jgi:hypothetical protein
MVGLNREEGLAMKALLSVVLMTGVIGSPQPALAQVPADPPAVWRLGGARSTTPAGPGRVKEVAGVLVSDSERKQIRLEAAGRALVEVPYERITSMHYEEAEYPRRFLRRPSFYLTVHYSDASGRPAFETIRLLSERDALSATDTLERDTERTFDRSRATRSFLGIPIRARIGTRVAVTDQTGQTTKGTIAQLSTVSLALDESAGVSRIFDETNVRKIRLLYSPKHDALVGLGIGAAGGAFLGATFVGISGCPEEGCPRLSAAAVWAGIFGGLGALIAPTAGAVRYPFNHAYDVYRGDAPGASESAAITIAPQVAQSRKAVLVSVRF